MNSVATTDIDSRLESFIGRPASNHFLQHISNQASLVIPCHHTNDQYKSPIPPLPTFVNLLAKRSCARTGTLLASLVLLDRLKQRLAQYAKGMPCTCQRIFLATLIVTTKLLHDTSPKNKHWTKYAVYFTLSEVNLMEKQLLALMNYQLLISQQDMYNSFITYENTTSIQLPPILLQQQQKSDRHYLPKSASYHSTPCYKSNNNATMIQQQYNRYSYDATIMRKKKNHNTKPNKRLNISTSSSSSSLSSMEDVYVVTPTHDYLLPMTHHHVKKQHYSQAPITWLDPIIHHGVV